jgi:hypothetical protein
VAIFNVELSSRLSGVFTLILLACGLACSKHDPPQPVASSGPVAAAGGSGASPGWFEDRASAAGIAFRQGHGGKSPLTILETIGTGCAILDFDGDGHADIFLVGQTGVGTPGHCVLYHNNGNGTFTDVTAGSGLEQPGIYMGCAVGDIDNDGRPDLLLTGYGVVRLFHNLGAGKFADVTRGSGLEAPSPTAWASSAGFADIDHDGLLDVYIGRYVEFSPDTMQFCTFGKTLSSCSPGSYNPQTGSLYRNRGHLRFKEVTQAMGLGQAHGKCLGVVFADVNGDGWPDLYLGNDEMPGELFINQQGKGFRDVAAESGVALSEDGRPQGAMGVEFGDFERSGRPGLFVTTYEAEPDSLYSNTGSGMFADRSLASGIGPRTMLNVGFGAKFLDVANSGWLDLAVANGHTRDNEEQIDHLTHYAQPFQLFRNEKGKAFTEKTQEAGVGFTRPAVGRGLATGDVNDDGKIDILATDLEGSPRLLMNRYPGSGAWLRVQLVGSRSNRMGIGAKVTVVAGSERWTAECTTGGSYLSACDARLHFGLGTLTAITRVEVAWPSGRHSVFANPHLPGDIRIQEP